jgi:hypothetical protein
MAEPAGIVRALSVAVCVNRGDDASHEDEVADAGDDVAAVLRSLREQGAEVAMDLPCECGSTGCSARRTALDALIEEAERA